MRRGAPEIALPQRMVVATVRAALSELLGPKEEVMHEGYADAPGDDAKRVHIGAKVVGTPIDGTEPLLRDLFRKGWTAYGGREAREGYEILRRMVAEDHAIVLAFSGAMASAGLVDSTVVPLVRAGVVDAVTTTHANIYHSIQRLVSDELRQVDPQGDDLALRKAGWTRIYDHAFPEETLFETDLLVRELLLHPDFQASMTTPRFHQLLAAGLDSRARDGKITPEHFRSSLLNVCLESGVPIFCGAPQDASIFLNVALLAARARIEGREFRFAIDLAGDIHEFAAYHFYAKGHGSRKLSICILGGGVPKNYSLQPEPYLSQICGVATEGYDCDVQICDAHVQDGGLSSCPAGEAHTWGKTSVECVQAGSRYVFADATLVAPLYVAALLQELRVGTLMRKTPRRLLDHREKALRELDAALVRATAAAETVFQCAAETH